MHVRPFSHLFALQALIEFENVLALEPKNYVGDDFARVTQTYRVTQYNVACCYAAMDQVGPGLSHLESCYLIPVDMAAN